MCRSIFIKILVHSNPENVSHSPTVTNPCWWSPKWSSPVTCSVLWSVEEAVLRRGTSTDWTGWFGAVLHSVSSWTLSCTMTVTPYTTQGEIVQWQTAVAVLHNWQTEKVLYANSFSFMHVSRHSIRHIDLLCHLLCLMYCGLVMKFTGSHFHCEKSSNYQVTEEGHYFWV